MRRFPEVRFVTATQAARDYADGARGREFSVKELQAIAQTGLAYSRDPYDLDRFRQVRALAARILAAHSSADPRRMESFSRATRLSTSARASQQTASCGSSTKLSTCSDNQWYRRAMWFAAHIPC